MMLDAVDKIYRSLSNDKRVNVWHMSIFMALLYLWKQNDYSNPVAITRRVVMALAHVHSIVTYHKCIKELQQYGYILYEPSFNPSIGSFITIQVK
jgi:hypothetical protein